MKNILFAFLFLSAGATVLGQDPMQTNRNDLSGRTAARDMNKTVTPPALPVYNTYIPPEITTRTTGTYSKGLYAITQVKSALKETAYQVTLLDNGQTKYEWIDENGAAVATVFRTPETDSINDLAYRNMMNGVRDSTQGMQNTGNPTNVNANNSNMQQNNQMNNANKQMNNNMNNQTRAATDTVNRMNNNNMGNMNNMNTMDSTRNKNRMDSTRNMTDTSRSNMDTTMRRDTATRRDTINNSAGNRGFVPNPGNDATLNAGTMNTTTNKEAKTDSSSKSSADKPKENK
jgi:hypothetical protein